MESTNWLIGFHHTMALNLLLITVLNIQSINYRHVPVKSLYELRRLIHDMDEFLPLCNIPVLILHGEHDPIVSVNSAPEIMDKLETGNQATQDY